ncbi:RNA polymerase sigma factor, sigma-70 family [Bacteroidales bacterium 6E]|nr:RNA polymerase sigma factor, sigma-70 family [Bacteroidales bacterium 6E]
MKETYNHLKDEDLAKRIISGEAPELFAVLHHRYHHKINDKVFGFIKDRVKSEEFTNDILSRIYEKLPGFKGNATFSSWVYSITYNYCIDYLRFQKKLHYPEWNKNNDIPEIPDEAEEDLSGVTYENLLKILEMIHPEEKALILMKYQDDLSLKQITSTLRISEDAVKMRLKRARTRIIFFYKKHFQD